MLSAIAEQGAAGDKVARAAETVAALRGQGSLFGRRARPASPGGRLSLVREAGDGRMQFFERVHQLFLEVSRSRPPVFLVHDLHLADGASVQLLAYLLRTLAPAPGFSAPGDEGFTGLFVATQLDGDVGGSRVPAWMTDVAATVIAVGGLDLEGIRALLSSPAVLEK